MFRKFIALFISIAALLMMFTGCTVDENNPVILTAGKATFHKFDFNLKYLNGEYYYHYTLGAMSDEQYFQLVLDEVTELAVALNEAKKRGIELTEAEETELQTRLDEECELVMEQYRSFVDSSITDEAEIQKAAEEQLVTDLGFSYEDYRKYYEVSLRNTMILTKLYNEVTADVTPDEDDIRSYIESCTIREMENDFATFAETYKAFLKDGLTTPYFIPANCITVNHIYLPNDDAEALAAEEIIDAELSKGGMTFERFEELIDEFGKDENMNSDRYREWGYLVHDSLESDFVDGYVFAANRLIDDSKLMPGAEDIPEFTEFKMDGSKYIIKLMAEDGIYYIGLNQRFLKGSMPCEEGGDIWNISYEGAYVTECDYAYQLECDKWLEDTKVTYFYENFVDEYVN